MKSGHCDYHKGECCAQWLIGDGICQEQNDFLRCDNFDGLDCKYDADGHCEESLIGDGKCDLINIHYNCSFDGGDCCTNVFIGNGKSKLRMVLQVEMVSMYSKLFWNLI